MHLIVALLWLAGGWLRIYQQARFFQIEEYMNGRYWHWLLSHPERWGWRRPIFAWTATLLASFLLLRFVTDEWLWLIIYVAAALVAIWPTREKEIKKVFVPTPRAVRLLIAAGLLFAAVSLLAAGLASQIASPEVPVSAYLFTAGLDLVLFLFAPLFLIAGNGLAYPVEAGLRRFYLAKAGSTLRALEPTVIGITGSFGKTSTKHFLTHILNGRYHAIATPKSYNTLMGVSLAINTLLKDERQLDYFVVEMGAYIPGEIARICALARPQISLVTAIGPQHLERFGTLDAVVEAKAEILAALPPDGAAILNGDDARVRGMADRVPGRQVILVSREELAGAGLLAKNVSESLDGLSFDVVDPASGEERHFQAPLYGLHNVNNLLLAIGHRALRGAVPGGDRHARRQPGTFRAPFAAQGPARRPDHPRRRLQRQSGRRAKCPARPGPAQEGQAHPDHTRHGRTGLVPGERKSQAGRTGDRGRDRHRAGGYRADPADLRRRGQHRVQSEAPVRLRHSRRIGGLAARARPGRRHGPVLERFAGYIPLAAGKRGEPIQRGSAFRRMISLGMAHSLRELICHHE